MPIRLTWQCLQEENDSTPDILEQLRNDPSFFLLYMSHLYNEGLGAMMIEEEIVHPNPDLEMINKENLEKAVEEMTDHSEVEDDE
jgi:hypothetical protein